VPEQALDDPSIVLPQGYGESKWICERLLDAARTKSGVSSAVLRVGQIAGPVENRRGEGALWNKQEWLPSVRLHSPNSKLILT
jgi:thioester reductase-like protein